MTNIIVVLSITIATLIVIIAVLLTRKILIREESHEYCFDYRLNSYKLVNFEELDRLNDITIQEVIKTYRTVFNRHKTKTNFYIYFYGTKGYYKIKFNKYLIDDKYITKWY